MNDFDKFEKDFDKTFKRTTGVVVGVIIFNCLLGIGVLGGLGFAGYKILQYFGVM
ncbi:hypothetical protein [Alkalicoccobacillus gibsonii]|uniref:hypothetical protein n=1 Tax=Alkalicoccobacillus gibsonii TaxID=79881 RepID=UPI0019342CBC|nr:hypothetical protein [Alkalicoccobacillus gibsonii]MBM0064769.1 hypothetical protein [Alkalicoccobacillus gibsonii]